MLTWRLLTRVPWIEKRPTNCIEAEKLKDKEGGKKEEPTKIIRWW